MNSHVVLGGNGAVGRSTVTALAGMGADVVSVGRRPAAMAGVRSVTADVQDPQQTMAAVDDAAVVYLTVGVPYRTSAWRRQWPGIVRNTIEASLASGAHLVMFDNVYAYGPVDGPMTEATPYLPTTRKGRVRLELLRMLESAMGRGLGYTVARSADFYGPGAAMSPFTTMAIDAVVAGKQPRWLFDATTLHSMTYVPDIGRTLALIGTQQRAQGGTWHVPTAPPLTGEQYLALAMGGPGRFRTLSLASLRMTAPFVPLARELLELPYQSTADYVFDSSAFEAEFGLAPTSYAEGVATTLAAAQPTSTRAAAGSGRRRAAGAAGPGDQ